MVFKQFFTKQIASEPILNLEHRAILLMLLAGLIYFSFRYYQKSWYRSLFWCLQCFQLVSLYSWYILVGWPLSGSLPLYHCRLAMFVILWGRSGKFKRYFAYLGLFGSVVALIYPIFDPFNFPHITFFSFVLGHYALAVNCLIYLLSNPNQDILGKKRILIYTLIMNTIILLANSILGGNYGFLAQAPLIHSQNRLLNFILITSLIYLVISLMEKYDQKSRHQVGNKDFKTIY